MELNNNILSLIEPKIRPTDVELKGGTESGEGDKTSKSFGTDLPRITINNYLFEEGDLISFKLNTGITKKYPTVNVTVIDTGGTFDIDQFPRDGDVITVYINSKNTDTFKSIHMDFNITSISSPPKGLPNSLKQYSFQGTCKVPGLFSEDCVAYTENTSLGHLEEIATNLELGLASNIDSTDDTQNRLQAYTTTLDYIKETVNSSYIDEESFQTFYIDQYYNLNFVEMNRIFNSENVSLESMQSNFASLAKSFSQEAGVEDNTDNIENKLMLTNNTQFDKSNVKISQFALKNNSSKISLLNGYRRVLQMWDELEDSEPTAWDTERLVEFDVEAYTSKNIRDVEEPLKGRRGETEYDNHSKYKWVGRMQDYSLEGNVHLNHKYSILNNWQNLQELEKIKLVVELDSFNPSLYVCQKIPVMMYTYDEIQSAAATKTQTGLKDKGVKTDDKAFPSKTEEVEATEAPVRQDDFTSGHYVIGGIEYIYSDGDQALTQRLTLLRREWPTRANNL
jgi:hypothetical protein